MFNATKRGPDDSSLAIAAFVIQILDGAVSLRVKTELHDQENMKNKFPGEDSTTPNDSSEKSRRWWLFLAGCALAVLLGVALRSQREDPAAFAKFSNALDANGAGRASVPWGDRRSVLSASSSTARSAEEIVAGKVSQFGRSRHEIVRTIAQRSQLEVPSEIENFFKAIDSGLWEEIELQWNALSKQSGQFEGSTHSPELDPFWPAVLDAYGAAEQAHLWPAQKLLDYGNAILDSLRPGMVSLLSR